MQRKNKISDIIHFLTGLIAGLFTIKNPMFAFLITFVFVVYEISEDRYLKDGAYKDILEFAIGLFLGGVLTYPNTFICFPV